LKKKRKTNQKTIVQRGPGVAVVEGKFSRVGRGKTIWKAEEAGGTWPQIWWQSAGKASGSFSPKEGGEGKSPERKSKGGGTV